MGLPPSLARCLNTPPKPLPGRLLGLRGGVGRMGGGRQGEKGEKAKGIKEREGVTWGRGLSPLQDKRQKPSMSQTIYPKSIVAFEIIFQN